MSGVSPAAYIKTQASTPDVTTLPSPNADAGADSNRPVPTTETGNRSQDSVTYPDASLFTFLPDLYLVISRLSELRNPPVNNSSNLLNGSTAPATQVQTQSSGTTATIQADGSGSSSNNNNPNSNLTQTLTHDSQHSGSLSLRNSSSNEANSTIEIRDLPAHVYGIKKGIAAAKEVVSRLPDVERGVEEQEAEIRQLKAHVAALKGRLSELGGIAGRGREDVVMSGVEGS